jgi:hypothetical protein
MNMTIYKDQLEAVYRLIEKPENWTQGAYARSANGALDRHGDDEWVAEDAAACQWCLLGAGIKCGIDVGDMYDKLFPLAREAPHEFNDNHTHAEVLALLKSAIDRAPERP